MSTSSIQPLQQSLAQLFASLGLGTPAQISGNPPASSSSSGTPSDTVTLSTTALSLIAASLTSPALNSSSLTYSDNASRITTSANSVSIQADANNVTTSSATGKNVNQSSYFASKSLSQFNVSYHVTGDLPATASPEISLLTSTASSGNSADVALEIGGKSYDIGSVDFNNAMNYIAADVLNGQLQATTATQSPISVGQVPVQTQAFADNVTLRGSQQADTAYNSELTLNFDANGNLLTGSDASQEAFQVTVDVSSTDQEADKYKSAAMPTAQTTNVIPDSALKNASTEKDDAAIQNFDSQASGFLSLELQGANPAPTAFSSSSSSSLSVFFFHYSATQQMISGTEKQLIKSLLA